MLSWPGRIPGSCSIASNWRKQKDLRGWKTKSNLHQTLIFESLFELRKLEADTMQKGQPGCLSIGLS